MKALVTVLAIVMVSAGCSGGGDGAAIAGKQEAAFETYVKGLESDDVKTRQEAFDFLASRGEKGLEALREFCERHTDSGWGEEAEGFRCRISADRILHYEPGGLGPHFKGNYIDETIKVEVKNVTDKTVSIVTYDGGIITNPLHHSTIETYVGGKPDKYEVIYEIMVPEIAVQVRGEETLTGIEAACDIRCFDWSDDEIVCFRNYKNMDKGIHFLRYTICVFRGSEYGGASYVISNRICFALLPAQKKE
jgi:hypothetical protein